jgi:YVTN family beta-propeller protein
VRAAVGADGLDASGTDVGESLLVVNRSGHEVVRVDLATGSVRARWKTGDGPHEVVLAGNRHAYVPAFGIYPEAHASPFPSDSRPPSVTGRGGALTVVDTETQAVRTLDVAPCMRPHGVAASRDGARVWVTCQDLREVREFDGATGSLRRTFATQADGSHIVVASPSDDALWVANVTDGNVTAIDLASGSTSVVPTAPGAEGIAFAPDARELWVANTRDNSISIIDAARRAVIETVSSGGEFPVKLAFIASRGETWVVNNGSNSIAVFDARTRRLKASIPLDTTPLGIAASGDGDRVYVSAPRENGVLVIDAESRQVTRRIRTGIEPDGIVWVPAPARR